MHQFIHKLLKQLVMQPHNKNLQPMDKLLSEFESRFLVIKCFENTANSLVKVKLVTTIIAY